VQENTPKITLPKIAPRITQNYYENKFLFLKFLKTYMMSWQQKILVLH
jgi:hypothetical protein